MDDELLNSSELGTKLYWDSAYESELQTFEECGNEGEVWFGESVSHRMIQCLNSLQIDRGDPIIDLGCGNGLLVISAWECGYTNLLGVDYSEKAIQLASSVSKTRPGCSPTFKVQNLVTYSESEESFNFKVALDKGTYDAISLDPEDSARSRQLYLENVFKILLPGGFLIITTCNWTETEIISQFKAKLIHRKTIPSPKLIFGGRSGQQTTTMVFEKSTL